ncbi:T9SS type A sorting domain-containing protein, partial [bacterium]|nr:T9SS type A sorting domain-containing protein [bacterium]
YIDDTPYLFLGLERMGGFMVYDISDPAEPQFETYVNNRDFSVTVDPDNLEAVGDLGPEGLVFIPAADSPNGNNLLVVANEVSGSVSIWEVTVETKVEEQTSSPAIPSTLPLSEAYPNPFNPTTNIDLTLPNSARIRVELFDITGRHVRSIARGAYSAGTCTFTIDAVGLASGSYFVRADATTGGHAVRRITLTK